MLRKLIAGLLLVLAASPFTAPFATCDVPTLFCRNTSIAPGWTTHAVAVDDHSMATVMYGTLRRVRAPLKPASHSATLEAVDLAAPQAVTLTVETLPRRSIPPDLQPITSIRV